MMEPSRLELPAGLSATIPACDAPFVLSALAGMSGSS